MNEMMAGIEQRVEVVRNIQAMAGLAAPNKTQLYSQEYSAARYRHLTGLLPTIGCEVEVNASTLMPDVFALLGERQDARKSYERLDPDAKSEFDRLYNEQNQLLEPKFQLTNKLGIPRNGHDGYWEFSHDPTYHWRTLDAEVSALFKLGLIPEGYHHSLHITLGSLAVDGGGMAVIASGLEFLHASPERFRMATATPGKMRGFARKGVDGLRERAYGIQLEDDVATEIRTLSIDSPDNAHAVLRSTQLLGASLLGFRRRDAGAPAELVDSWREFRQAMRDLWADLELPTTSWGRPENKPHYWLRWADAIQSHGEHNDQVEFEEMVSNICDNLESFLTSQLDSAVLTYG